jgi:signal transduction histidine kinase
VTGALTDVRRLIYELRPPALDELGLVEAVRRHAQRLDRRSDGAPIEIAVHADGPLPDLPAAVEVAAYRILTEALTNVARHSHASRVDVDIVESAHSPAGLELTVQDDSAMNGSPAAWTPGVGLRSMYERATELCGTVRAEPTPAGGRVHARLPLGADRASAATGERM